MNDVEFGMESMGTTDENQENRTGVSDNKVRSAFKITQSDHLNDCYFRFFSFTQAEMVGVNSQMGQRDLELSCLLYRDGNLLNGNSNKDIA